MKRSSVFQEAQFSLVANLFHYRRLCTHAASVHPHLVVANSLA